MGKKKAIPNFKANKDRGTGLKYGSSIGTKVSSPYGSGLRTGNGPQTIPKYESGLGRELTSYGRGKKPTKSVGKKKRSRSRKSVLQR